MCLSNQFTMWDLIKGPGEVHVDNIHCLALISTLGYLKIN